MASNFYWLVESGIVPVEIKLPTGKIMTVGQVDLDDPRVHIAKRDLKADASTFIWAQHRATVIGICEKHRTSAVVVDHTGKRYTGQEFLDILDPRAHHLTELIGHRFS